jgi:pilus assembly protein CpaF
LSDKGDYRTQDIFVFTPLGKDSQGRIFGYHSPTGVVPHFVHKARAYGFEDLTDAFFDPATYGFPPPPNFHAGDERHTQWAPSLKHREKGEQDPADFAARWAAFQKKLRQEAEAEAKARPASKPAPAAAAAPTRPPVAVKHDQDKTPPPTRRPVAPPNGGSVRPKPPQPAHEPLVQVDQSLLDDAGPSTDLHVMPKVQPVRPGVAGVPTRKLVQPQRLEDGEEPETNIKPTPERPKR